jgi:hypothetical protein
MRVGRDGGRGIAPMGGRVGVHWGHSELMVSMVCVVMRVGGVGIISRFQMGRGRWVGAVEIAATPGASEGMSGGEAGVVGGVH